MCLPFFGGVVLKLNPSHCLLSPPLARVAMYELVVGQNAELGRPLCRK